MKNDPYIVAEFIKSKLADHSHAVDGTHPLITISRQHGVGGYAMALRIAEILTQKKPRPYPLDCRGQEHRGTFDD